MKKGFIVGLLILSSLLILAGCSIGSKKSSAHVTTDHVQKYDEKLQEYMNELTAILKTYNDGLDGFYIGQDSQSQFSSIVVDEITKSNKLVNNVESLDVQPDLFETQQNLIQLVNDSHQLLLDTVELTKSQGNAIDKEGLRSRLVDIKTRQAKFINDWRVAKENLNSTNNNKKGPLGNKNG